MGIVRCNGCGSTAATVPDATDAPRCSACGSSDLAPAPLLAGGQGRDESEVAGDGAGCGLIITIAVLAFLAGGLARLVFWFL